MEKIGVKLYGGKSIFGKKETPLEADVITCDRANDCSYYKAGKCLNCRSFLSPMCKFGKVQTIKGYTSRASKYYDFKKKWQNEETYNKLDYPRTLVSIMGDTLYMNLKFTLVRKKVTEEKVFSRHYYRCVEGYEITECGFCSGDCFMPIADLTIDLLEGILSYVPCAMMGGVIADYQDKVVPEVVQELRKLLPDFMTEFLNKYPQYDKEPNYIGKKVYVCSLKPNTEFTYKDSKWLYDGKYVSAQQINIGFYSPWFSDNAKYTDVKIEVNEKMTIEVNDNSIVDENTRFAD